ncbi:2-C-methyl-D-erythritol 2,4-cyclodiphosphate synthase [Lachnospiraceae bacterium XPB1003]|nr:2-C-methyl-D-erythritol 2,4-cyclodiphosphate synthase [Lachnospiraceae bacterium XPB1003]
MRIGSGYDVHRMGEGRKLIIGGVDIPYKKGLVGHSDADVLIHAIMDALLGAAALGDIGKHFPDTDPKWKGASSIKMLEMVRSLIEENGFIIENIDSTIRAQRPKLSPYIEEMRLNIASALKLSVGQVNVKATTEEHLGFTGREEGIAADAVCLLTAVSEAMSVDVTDRGVSISSDDEEKASANSGRCGSGSPCAGAGGEMCPAMRSVMELKKKKEDSGNASDKKKKDKKDKKDKKEKKDKKDKKDKNKKNGKNVGKIIL